jgi:hypothetical protein
MENDSWNFSPGGTPKQARPAGQEPAPAPAALPTSPRVAQPVVPPAPQPQIVYPHPAPLARPTNGMANASLVLGILGMFLPILSILALIFGGIGISKANQGASGKGMAVAGLVLGILGTLVLLYAFSESS